MLTHRPARATPSSAASTPWVHGPVSDVLLGWCWLPIALAMHRMESQLTRTQILMAVIFVISFAHQPLTLGLVYGDAAQRQAHRRLYLWAPIVAVIAIAIGLNVSLALVGAIGGLWNAEHTLMQRYGVMRIYGRKAGDDNGRLEKPMLVAWLVTALLFLAAFVDLRRLGTKLGIDETNTRSVDTLHAVSGVATPLIWIGSMVSLVLAVRWARAERRTPPTTARTAKWLYAAGTLGLVIAVMIDPIAGVAGYVGAHAIEYFGIVHSSLVRRAGTADDAVVIRASRTRTRRAGLYVAYLAAIAGLIATTWDVMDGRLYAYLILFFGALHILYDGFVWKLRKPAVAASLGIAPAPN
jgi:uncharacterized membrane protein YidH (DUF202 family)